MSAALKPIFHHLGHDPSAAGDGDEESQAQGTLRAQKATTPSVIRILFVCCATMLASAGMTSLNKLIGAFSTIKQYPFTLVGLQAVVAVAAGPAASRAGLIRIDSLDKLKSVWIKILPVSALFATMLASSILAFRYTPLSYFTSYKNLANLGIAGGEVLLLGESMSFLSTAGLLLSVTGSIITSINDQQSGDDAQMTAAAYFWTITNCVASAAYVLALRLRTREGPTSALQKASISVMNNANTAVICLLIALASGEIPRSLVAVADAPNAISLLLTGTGSLMLGVLAVVTISLTSATTFAMVGAMNKVLTLLFAVIVFEEALTMSSTAFVLMGIAGGVMYGLGKQK